MYLFLVHVRTVLWLALLCLLPGVLWSHDPGQGSLDEFGGHLGASDYHFHRGPLAGQSFPDQAHAMYQWSLLEHPPRFEYESRAPASSGGGPTDSDLKLARHVGDVSLPDFDFRAAKKHLRDVVYYGPEMRKTIYCGCSYRHDMVAGQRKLIVDHASCGYRTRSGGVRALYVEWEHAMPASWFGSQRQCWQGGLGRTNCRKTDKVFVAMEADMHNLFPAIGEVNMDRSYFRFQEIPGEQRLYGQCDFEFDPLAKHAEPAPAVRGDLARANLYMVNHYGLEMSRSQYQLLNAWHQSDPPDAIECERNRRIARIQGWDNPLITSNCTAE